MKVKKIIIITVCMMFAAFVFGAAGIFNLASTSEDETTSKDRLIGVLITREDLDLFDSEQFIIDNIDTLAGGREISESGSSNYQGRLYATRVETSDTDDETGETSSTIEYVFEGIDGICYFTPRITDQFDAFWSLGGDDAISDAHTHFNSTDEGESIAMEGTIYVSTHGNAGNFFYFNPVYQTPTEEVYAVSGDGEYFGDNSVETSTSFEIKENQSSTIDNLTTSSGTEIKVTIRYMDKPEKVSILQFDEEDELLSRMEYDPSDLPDTLQVQSGTQYIIVETTTCSQEQTFRTTREIFEPEDDTLFAFFSRDDGICVKQECQINWNN